MVDKKKIGQNLDEIRKARGWTKAELARQAGISPWNVGDNIKNGTISLESLVKYANALGCTADDILGDSVDRTKFNPIVDLEDFFPYNLAVAVYLDSSIMENVNIPRLREAFATLTDREQAVIYCRFRAHMTLEDTAKIYDVTRERIRQVEAKALRKLRHPSRKFIFDIDKMEKQRKDALEKCSRLELENITLRDKLSMKPEGEVEPEPETPKAEDIPIDELELSVRSYNCLKRAGFNTVEDLSKTTIEKLMRVRNLGKRSIDEILAKLKEHGIEVKSETGQE